MQMKQDVREACSQLLQKCIKKLDIDFTNEIKIREDKIRQDKIRY